MPVSNKIIDISFGDKLNHFGAFFVLYFVGYFRYGKLNNYKFISGLIFYGIFIETVQYFLPFREFSLLDVLADSFGVLISYLILNLLSKKNISNI